MKKENFSPRFGLRPPFSSLICVAFPSAVDTFIGFLDVKEIQTF